MLSALWESTIPAQMLGNEGRVLSIIVGMEKEVFGD
jgi:hypothetical protein